MPRETPAKFSTAYGSDISTTSRVQDRNAGAREAERALRWDMREPYPRGYTGHIPGIRATIGSTYGKQTRYAVNQVSHGFEEPRVGEMQSTYIASFVSPREQVAGRKLAAASSTITSRPEKALISTAHDGFKFPPQSSYQPPPWTERATSNIGQPDVYKHFKESTIHRPEEYTLKKMQPPPSSSTLGTTNKSGTSHPRVLQTTAAAAGLGSRPDAWLLTGRR